MNLNRGPTETLGLTIRFAPAALQARAQIARGHYEAILAFADVGRMGMRTRSGPTEEGPEAYY